MKKIDPKNRNTAAGADPVKGKPDDQAGAAIGANAPADNSATAAGAQGDTTDATRGQAEGTAGAPQSGGAPETSAVDLPIARFPQPPRQTERVVLGWPLPADLPAVLLETAQLVVKAKPQQGRRRAGRSFSRTEESRIPLDELSAEQIAAIVGDHDLVVSVEIEKPV